MLSDLNLTKDGKKITLWQPNYGPLHYAEVPRFEWLSITLHLFG